MVKTRNHSAWVPIARPQPADAILRRSDAECGGARRRGYSSEFALALSELLQRGQISAARALIADATAFLSGTERRGDLEWQDVTESDLIAAKARVALATGDGKAAHAIVLTAVEGGNSSPALQALLAELMLANGNGGKVRSVLEHITPKSQYTDKPDARDP